MNLCHYQFIAYALVANERYTFSGDEVSIICRRRLLKDNLLARIAGGVGIGDVVIGYLQTTIGSLQRLHGY